MMTTAIHTTDQPTESVGSQIPPVVLMIGKKRASEYIAPALFRMASFSLVEIRAKGALSIATAVDVAELVKRNVEHALVQSISLGTEELTVDGIMRRVSSIEIHIVRQEQSKTLNAVVEEDPAAVAERITSEGEKRKRAKTSEKKKKSTKRRRLKAKSST